MAIVERIFTVYNDKGSKQAVKDLAKLEKQFAEAGKKMAKAFGVAALAVGAFAVKLGKDAVQAAMEDQKSQTLLANALRNTVGATDAAIAASEAFVTSLQMQLGVADDQLRPALSTLVIASGDLAQAQTLLGLALDVSAGSGKSLEAVTNALAKAQNGNFSALSRMFPALDKNAIASGDLVAITKELATLYGGAAEENANTFAGQMNKLKLAFGEILESIGYKLIPILQNLVSVINERVIPAIEEWLEKNGDKLAGVFKTAIGYVVAFFQSLVDAFSFVARNSKVFAQLGAIIIATFAGAKVAAAVTALVKGIKAIITVMKALKTASLASAAATALATGGVSAAAGAAAFGVALIGVNAAMNKFNKDSDKASDALGNFNFKSIKLNANDYTKGLDKLTVSQNKNTKATKAATDAQIQSEKILAKLKGKFGVVPTTENDPIQLEAARLNLIRQGKIAEAEAVAEKQRLLAEQLKLNDAAMKYNDILALLGDRKLSPDEIALLASKWGMSNTEVLAYLQNIFGIQAVEGGYDFSASGKDAEDGWIKALAALDAYKNGLATIGKGIVPKEEDRARRGYGTGYGTGSGLITLPNGKTVDPTNTFTVAGKTIIANSGIIQSDTTGDTPSMTAARQRIADIFATIGAFGGQGYVPKGGVSNTGGSTNITVNVQGTLLDTGGLKTAVVNAVTEAGFSGRNTTYNRGLISE